MNSSANKSRDSLYPGGGECCEVSASDRSLVWDVYMMLSI
jgi:hypothetical protein